MLDVRRRLPLRLAALGAALLGSGGCSLLVGSELSDKPVTTTGAGGAGGQSSSAESSSAHAASGPGSSAAGPSGAAATTSAAAGPTTGSGGALCSADLADCDGDPQNGCEVNIKTDKNNCGACKHKCSKGATCDEKKCH